MATKNTILDQLHRIGAILHRGHRHMEHAGGPHRGKGRLLAMLADMEGASQRVLCERLDIRPGSLSELIDRLEHAGLVERRQDADDKRVANIVLTERGRIVSAEANDNKEKYMEEMFAGLTEEESATLSGLLDKLLQGMERFAGGDDEGPHKHHGHGCHGHGRHGHAGEAGRHHGCHRHKHGRGGKHMELGESPEACEDGCRECGD